VLWLDRFTPAEMLGFANYLRVPIHPVETPPPVEGAIDVAAELWRAIGRKRAQIASFAVVGLIGLALTIFLAVVAFQSVNEWSAYQRAGTCPQPPSDPLSCRLETGATVTGVDVRQSYTGVYLHFSQDVLFGVVDHRSKFVWLLLGSRPQPPVVAGRTAMVEVFDRQAVTVVNGAYTRDYQVMKSNANWWYVVVPAVIPVFMGVLAYGSWRGNVSGYVESDEERAKRKRSAHVSWPHWLSPVGRVGSRLWMAWVG
jgi:hypothetical protein